MNQSEARLAQEEEFMWEKVCARLGHAAPSLREASTSRLAETTRFGKSAGAYAPSRDGLYYTLNKKLIEATTSLVVRDAMSISQLSRFMRGQTQDDNRPNKALITSKLASALATFPEVDTILSIANNGVTARLDYPLECQASPPINHPSASAHLNVVLKNLRKEQDAGRCIIVSYSAVRHLWGNIHFSPIGVVKKEQQELSEGGRIIHDLSWPMVDGSNSVNCRSAQSEIPKPHYTHCSDIATRVLDLKRRFPDKDVHIMKGDVASAFRHVPLNEDSVHLFAYMIHELDVAVLELACPFGCLGKPYGYVWVDDHVNAEVNINRRLIFVAFALRNALVTVLGPRAINEKKFSLPSTTEEALGIVLDTKKAVVRMPVEKVTNALTVIDACLGKPFFTKKDLQSVEGTLRSLRRASDPDWHSCSSCTTNP